MGQFDFLGNRQEHSLTHKHKKEARKSGAKMQIQAVSGVTRKEETREGAREEGGEKRPRCCFAQSETRR